MANENVTRVVADATGYTTELDRASRSAQAFAEQNEVASQRIAAAQQAVAEAATNGSTASARAITTFINSLSRQADAAGKSTTELMRQRAAALGVADAAESMIQRIEDVARANAAAAAAARAKSDADRAASAEAAGIAAAQERAAAETQRFIDSLTKEAATLGLSRTELLAMETAQRGATAETAGAIAKIEAYAESAAAAAAAAKAKAIAEREAASAAAAIAAANDRAAAETQRFVDAIQKEAETLGLSRTELLALEAAQRGVANETAGAIAKIDAYAESTAAAVAASKAKATAEREAAADAAALAAANDRAAADTQRFVDAIKKEADTLGLSRTELLQREAAQRGVTAETDEAITKIQAHAKATAAAADAEREATAEAARLAAANQRAAADTQRFVDAVTKEAAAIGKTRTELLAEEAAQRGVSDETSKAIAKIQAHAAATEAASKHTHEFNLNNMAARRELLVLAHELSQGNIKQFGGSMLVLAERADAMSLIFNTTALSIGAFVAVIGVSALATYHAAEALAEYGESIEKIAKTTGLSTNEIQSFSFAAGTVGVKTKDASEALAALGKAQNEALHGNNDAAAAFKALGISMDTLKTASPDQVLARVADAFAGAKDGAAKAAVATELFGSAGTDLIPLLDGGSQKIDALTKSAQDAGAVLGDDTVAQLAAFKEQLALSQEKIAAASLSAKTALIPTIINLTAALGDNVALKPVLIDFYNGVSIIMKTAASAVATLVIGFEQTAEVLATIATVVGYGLTGQFKMAALSAQAGYENLKKEGTGYADFMAKLWSNATPSAPHLAAPTKTISYAQGQNSQKNGSEDGLNSQMRDLKDQLDAREKLIATNVDHIKSLQQQGIIDARTAIQQEHDARADGYADELKLADQEIALAQHKKQTQALTEWQNKKKAIQAAIAKNDQDANDSLALLQAKETAATKAYTDALSNALQVRAEAISSQMQGKTLGATDADDLARATAAAKEYSDKYAELTKSLTEKKISSDQYADEITALQAYEEKRLALESQATAQIRVLNADGYAGAQKAVADYAEDAANRFKQVGSIVSDMTRGMEDAFVTFATTGKLSFSSLATSVVADIARMQARAAISGLFNYAVGAISSYFGGGSSFSTLFGGASTSTVASVASGSSVGDNAYGFHLADGGHVQGAGTSTSDSIRAWLSNGEYVLKAATVQRLGVSNLDALNNGGRIDGLARFATGGYVGNAPDVAAQRSGDTHVQVGVTANGAASFDQSDASWLQGQVQKLVDSRMDQKMKGQGGYLWKNQYGRV